MQGTWVYSLVGELRSHMPWGNQAHVQNQICPRVEMKTQHRQTFEINFFLI